MEIYEKTVIIQRFKRAYHALHQVEPKVEYRNGWVRINNAESRHRLPALIAMAKQLETRLEQPEESRTHSVGRRPSPFKCKKCGIGILAETAEKYEGMCVVCGQRTIKTTVPCAGCGKPRRVVLAYAAEALGTLCHRCARLPENKGRENPRTVRKRKGEKQEIRVNGCILLPGVGRCEKYFDCPNGYFAPLLDLPPPRGVQPPGRGMRLEGIQVRRR